MAKDQTDRINIFSEDIESENLNKLKSIFPQFVKDGQVDFDSLQEFFNKEGISSGTEKYGLSWNGKSNAFKAIRLPSTGTLNPQKEESKNWDNTKNIFIEGDNLEVLKLLQKHYREKIKMIYIDPPYNTGKDFVYKDNFTQSVADYYEQTGQTKDGIKMIANTEKNGRYHSDWLTMMYPRLFLAKNLLKDDGIIFVSIDDNEVANLRLIMDEIFGEDNFISSFIWQKNFAPKNDNKYISTSHEYVLFYAKNKLSFNRFLLPREEKHNSSYSNPDNDSRGDWTSGTVLVTTFSPSGVFEIVSPNGKKHLPPKGRCWRFSKDKIDELMKDNRLWFGRDGNGVPRIKRFLSEMPDGIVPQTLLKYDEVGSGQDGTQDLKTIFEDIQMFDFPKPLRLIQRLIKISTEKNDIVLDFFAGSGTTAHAVMDLNSEDEGNRKWICVQLPEETDKDSEAYKAGYKTISQIARERIRRVGDKYAYNYEHINNDTKKVELEVKYDGLDFGFKSYTLSKSNYRIWNELSADSDAKEIIEQSKLFIEKPLIDNYNEESVVNEILLKEGFNLNSKIEKGNGILKEYIVNSGEKNIFITFAKKVSKEEVEKLGIKESDTFVCFDSALDDTTKVNIGRSINLRVI